MNLKTAPRMKRKRGKNVFIRNLTPIALALLILTAILSSGCVVYQGITVVNRTDSQVEVTVIFTNATTGEEVFQRTLAVEAGAEKMVWKDPPRMDYRIYVSVENGYSSERDLPAEEVNQYRLVIGIGESGITWGTDAVD